MTSPAVVRQHSLREINLSTVLGTVFDSEVPISRAQVAARTGLTRATVSTLVDALVGARLIAELPPVTSTRAGRPAIPLAPHARSLVGMGLEVNVDYLGVCAVDLTGRVVDQRVRPASPVSSPPAQVLGDLGREARTMREELASQGMTLAGARLALPGLVRPDTGRLEVAPNLHWHDLEPVPLLGLDGLEVEVRNEAKLAGLAQTPMRSAMIAGGVTSQLPATFLYVSADVGIGSAVLVERDLYLGQHGWSGEIGHVVVHPGGEACGCGNRGCLEQYAGRPALMRAAGLGDAGDPRALRELVRSGDERAAEALRSSAEALAHALGDALNLLDVDVVVLGGIYAPLFEDLHPLVAGPLNDAVLASRYAPITLHRAAVESHAALIGGAREVLRAVLAAPTRWTG